MKSIKGFVDTVAVVTIRRAGDFMHGVYRVTGRKRVFAFTVDKVTDLHRIGDVHDHDGGGRAKAYLHGLLTRQ